MASRFCRICDVDYPLGNAHVECDVCGDPTVWQPYKMPDADWEAKVERLTNPSFQATDAIFSWRLEQLEAAGYTAVEALNLAASRVDLETARKLRPKTELAFQILI